MAGSKEIMSEIPADRALDSRAKLPTGGKFARARFFIPDAITSLNLFSGCLSMVSAFEGRFERAALLIEFSIACDILDGLFARASHTATKFGIEYDSLADLVAFGVAPASLVYSWALNPHGVWSIAVMASFIICAALRLARFNIQSATTAGKTRFVGLPVPGAAAMIAGLLLGYDYFAFDSHRVLCVSMAVVTVALARIMVSRIPYPALKSFDPRGHGLELASAIAVGAILLLLEPRLVAFSGGLLYFLSGPVLAVRGEQIDVSPAHL
jgi:CDP-diacylglycerol--serine O-phosphatidyltransferase